LGYSPIAYDAARKAGEKVGGDRRQVALYLEEIDSSDLYILEIQRIWRNLQIFLMLPL